MSDHTSSCSQRYEPRAQCSCGVDPTGALCREIERLRAELAESNRLHAKAWGIMRAERDKAEAAIARVRALCDDLHPFCKGGHVLDAIRDAAAIEGNQT